MKLLKEVLGNVGKKPFTLRYPKEKAEIPRGFRGGHEYDKEKCIWCGLCERFCPSGAIKIDKDKKEWSVDWGRCLFCGQCEEVCPTKCLWLGKKFEIASTNKEDFVVKY